MLAKIEHSPAMFISCFLSTLRYPKVETRGMSWLVAHPSIFRIFMKGKFDACAKRPKANRQKFPKLKLFLFTNNKVLVTLSELFCQYLASMGASITYPDLTKITKKEAEKNARIKFVEFSD